MHIKRRDFLKWGLVNAVLIGTVKDEPSGAQTRARAHPPVYRSGPSILQGATDSTKTQFSIVFDSDRDLDIFVTDSKGQRFPADKVLTIPFADHPKKITKVFFSGLVPNEEFLLNLVDSATGTLLDARSFQTLDLTKSSLKVALCSCMDESLHDPAIWRDMVSKSPDVLFFLGDCVYADTGASPAGADAAFLWKRFCESRTTLEIYYSKKLIPIIATWDDHDCGQDDANCRDYLFMKDSAQNFLQFFAQEASHCSLLQKGPGISNAFRYGEQLFLFLDGRSYRERAGSQGRYAHWGQEQEAWFMDLIAKNSGPTWFMTGSQMFPTPLWAESVSADYPVQFAAVLEQLKTISSKVIFVSGDCHFSEVSEIETEAVGYVTYELTSSSIHTAGTWGAPQSIPNKRRILATGERNYILVDSAAKGFGCAASATCFGILGQVHFSKNIEI